MIMIIKDVDVDFMYPKSNQHIQSLSQVVNRFFEENNQPFIFFFFSPTNSCLFENLFKSLFLLIFSENFIFGSITISSVRFFKFF